MGVLESGDVGHRVVVRHRTAAGATDVLGELTAFDDERLVVRTEAGELREIARADLVAGKPVGPRPAKYSEIIALEQVGARAWPAPVVEHLGEWQLRFADGWTNRANSAIPLGTADRTLEEAVQASVRFYRERGLLPKITVPLPARRDVARHLEATGWVAQPVVLVQTADLAEMSARGPSYTPGVSKVPLLTPAPSPEFLALYGARKQSLPAAAIHVLTAVPAVRFAEARDEQGTVLAIARGAVVDDWLHLGSVEVVEHARRQGLARVVSVALARWAREEGAARAFLQVEQSNEPAVRLYQSLGFGTHHTYVTYNRPAST